MNQDGLRIRVPASTSNLGPAFDSLGLALNLYLTVEVRRLPEGPSRIEYRGEDADRVTADGANYIGQLINEIAEREKRALPIFSLQVANEIPIAKGLGSSACALLAALAAADFLCGLHWGPDKYLEIAVAREGHPDNAAPSLWGGLVSSIIAEKVYCSKGEFPPDWTIVAVTPDFELPTKFARSVLPGAIPRLDAVYNVQRAAFLASQLMRGKREGLREAMRDRLHQPYRLDLVPGLREVLEMEDHEGLLGIALSGAGPTVIALADANEAKIGQSISDVFVSRGYPVRTRLLRADNKGLVLEYL